MSFIDVLWSGREERRWRRQAKLQKRRDLIAAYCRISEASRPHPARDVQAAPARPPVNDIDNLTLRALSRGEEPDA